MAISIERKTELNNIVIEAVKASKGMLVDGHLTWGKTECSHIAIFGSETYFHVVALFDGVNFSVNTITMECDKPTLSNWAVGGTVLNADKTMEERLSTYSDLSGFTFRDLIAVN